MPLLSFYALISVFLISFVSFAGAFALSLKEQALRRMIFVLVSLAAGALLGDAFIHLVPEAFERLAPLPASLLIIGGFLVFFILEKFLHWHHTHGGEEEEKKHDHAGAHTIHPTGYMILVSDGFHNFLDGLIIAVSFMAGIDVGIATTIAVILHEIPQEIGDFAILLHSGFSASRALFLNFLSALAAVLGALAVIFLGSVGAEAAQWLLPVVAGGFIYIASADLIPELHKTTDLKYSSLQFAAMLLGIAAMIALLFLE